MVITNVHLPLYAYAYRGHIGFRPEYLRQRLLHTACHDVRGRACEEA